MSPYVMGLSTRDTANQNLLNIKCPLDLIAISIICHNTLVDWFFKVSHRYLGNKINKHFMSCNQE